MRICFSAAIATALLALASCDARPAIDVATLAKSLNASSSNAAQPLMDGYASERGLFAATLALAVEQQSAQDPLTRGVCSPVTLRKRVTGVSDLSFAVYASGNIGYVVFRGTPSSQAFVQFSAVFTPVPCQILAGGQCGIVHKGFQQAYMALRNDVMSQIAAFQSVVLVGHSLGAAFAHMTALEMAAASGNQTAAFKPIAIYTLGAPKIGDGQFVAALDKYLNQVDVRRFVTLDGNYAVDLVTNLPPIAPYQHWKNPTYVNCGAVCSAGTAHSVPSYVEALKQADSQLRSVPAGSCAAWV